MRLFGFLTLLLVLSPFYGYSATSAGVKGGRFFTFNTVVRVNQIEVSRDKSVGKDEANRHTLKKVQAFRNAVYNGCPEARITWAFSWLSLHSDLPEYTAIRNYAKECHQKYGDDVTFIPGAFFANAYNSREQVNKDLHEGLAKVSEFMGDGFRPQSVVAGFLSAANQHYLAEQEGIHVCQGTIWSQYAIDNQDGDGSICYPYYPSKEHFCKPAQSRSDFIDCVCLDGWTMDFLAARREGFHEGFNSRLGVGPIETIGKYGPEIGLKEMLATTALHFDKGFDLNGFAWVTCCWEISLVDGIGHLETLTKWLKTIQSRWPDTRFVTQGEFGLRWRNEYKNNDDLNYRFVQRGTGIGGSDVDKEIRWYFNKQFRLALLQKISDDSSVQVIDFTRYDKKAEEPQVMIRHWSLMGEINQKQARPQDKPVSFMKLPERDRQIILKRYPELISLESVGKKVQQLPAWDDIESVDFKGNLKAFWNIGGKDKVANEAQAVAHGFGTVDLLNTYSDYPGRQKEKIMPNGDNPWKKPPFFERIIRRNIGTNRVKQIFVHDIEFHFEEHLDKLWANPEIRKVSGVKKRSDFMDAYYREWGTWYSLPCKWAKDLYPKTPIGIYGPQPFKRDYWGVAGKDAKQIDGTHKTDADLWGHIHPSVDFIIASIYCFYDKPGSIYYMASNVEENCLRIQEHGKKPLYAYLWMRYHNSNKKLGCRELDDYLVEAMAVIPYFCGAEGAVLWGWEPKGTGPYYQKLPLFMKSLKRVADLSDKISKAQMVNDEPVHVLWKEKKPLVRKLKVSDDEWLVLACTPWQKNDAKCTLNVSCGERSFDLPVAGKHSEIFHITGSKVKAISVH